MPKFNKAIIRPGTKKVLTYVNELGGIGEDQITHVMGEDAKIADFTRGALSSFGINYDNGMYVKEKPSYGNAMYMCGWVLIDNTETFDPNVKCYFKAESPAQIDFEKDGCLYELAYIDENGKGLLNILENRFYSRKVKGREKVDDSFRYIFVVKNENAIDKILETGLSIPYVVAVVHLKDRDESEYPNIEYFEQGSE